MAEARRLVRDPGLAVVAWLGYRPPATISAGVATENRADTGASELRRFITGLHGIDPGARTTLLCHSYGSVVCGEAARGLPVSDIAAFGSPGMTSSSAGALGTHAHVWAGRGADDWMRLVPHIRVLGLGFGTDPVSPRFGARVFAAGAGGHSDYLRPGSVSLHNLALITIGRDVDVVSKT
jgi:hypothetical protein